MAETLVQFEGVAKSLGGRLILDGLNWSLAAGECGVILGPSGSGKTVFLSTLLGFLKPDAGEVRYPGLDEDDLFGEVAVLFQEDALLGERTVETNLAVACCFTMMAIMSSPLKRPDSPRKVFSPSS